MSNRLADKTHEKYSRFDNHVDTEMSEHDDILDRIIKLGVQFINSRALAVILAVSLAAVWAQPDKAIDGYFWQGGLVYGILMFVMYQTGFLFGEAQTQDAS